jgi:hypothetical protein
MNQSSSETSGLSLPPPVAEQAPEVDVAPETGQQAESAPAASAEKAPTASQGALPAIPVIPVIPTDDSQLTPTDDSQGIATDDEITSSASTKALDDKDLIEREWVDKAKAIVEHTAEDPFKQTEEMSGLKADYLHQNYNKSIKLNK